MRKILAAAGLAGLMAAGTLSAAGAAHADPQAQVAAAPVVAPCSAITAGAPIVAPGGFTASLSDTRSAGHYSVVGATLSVYTDNNSSQAKVAEYLAIAPTSLSAAGEPSLVWTGTGIAPGMQLMVDLNNDGVTDGILVGETVYGNRWWASNSLQTFMSPSVPAALQSPGGDGGPIAGTLDTWLAAYPDAHVRAYGFSLGSGVLAAGVISSLTFGCTQSAFSAFAPAVFAQSVPFGSTTAGAPTATAVYTLASGPTGPSITDGTLTVEIAGASAAEIASCTVGFDSAGPASAALQYNAGAVLFAASTSAIVVAHNTTVSVSVACQTTAAATLAAYPVHAVFSYGAPSVVELAVDVASGQTGALDDVLTINAAAIVPSSDPSPSAAVLGADPLATTAALAATGPSMASGSLRLGLLALMLGIGMVALAGIGRRGSLRGGQH
jgi:hypothetical protein